MLKVLLNSTIIFLGILIVHLLIKGELSKRKYYKMSVSKNPFGNKRYGQGNGQGNVQGNVQGNEQGNENNDNEDAEFAKLANYVLSKCEDRGNMDIFSDTQYNGGAEPNWSTSAPVNYNDINKFNPNDEHTKNGMPFGRYTMNSTNSEGNPLQNKVRSQDSHVYLGKEQRDNVVDYHSKNNMMSLGGMQGFDAADNGAYAPLNY
jgi:hypothetical protein